MLTARIERSVAAVVVVLVLGIGLICLVNGAWRIGQPFPGFLVARNRIVLSVGRPGWSIETADRMLFAQIIAVGEHPIDQAGEISERIAGLPLGTPVKYRFRKHADVFAATLEVQRFQV